MFLNLANAQLDAETAAKLDATFSKTGDEFSLELVDGFFTCLLIGPKKTAADEALNLLAAALKHGSATPEELIALGEAMVELWLVRAAQLTGDETLEDTIWMPLLREQDKDENVAQFGKDWAEGFLLATNLHSDYWTAAAEQVEAVEDCATLLSALVSNEGNEGQLTPVVRKTLIDSLPIAVQSLAQYWRPWREQKTVIKDAKIGRNDPCPCGSGKKYKKCCGATTVH